MKSVKITYDKQTVEIPDKVASLYGIKDGYEVQSSLLIVDLLNRTTVLVKKLSLDNVYGNYNV